VQVPPWHGCVVSHPQPSAAVRMSAAVIIDARRAKIIDSDLRSWHRSSLLAAPAALEALRRAETVSAELGLVAMGPVGIGAFRVAAASRRAQPRLRQPPPDGAALAAPPVRARGVCGRAHREPASSEPASPPGHAQLHCHEPSMHVGCAGTRYLRGFGPELPERRRDGRVPPRRRGRGVLRDASLRRPERHADAGSAAAPGSGGGRTLPAPWP